MRCVPLSTSSRRAQNSAPAPRRLRSPARSFPPRWPRPRPRQGFAISYLVSPNQHASMRPCCRLRDVFRAACHSTISGKHPRPWACRSGRGSGASPGPGRCRNIAQPARRTSANRNKSSLEKRYSAAPDTNSIVRTCCGRAVAARDALGTIRDDRLHRRPRYRRDGRVLPGVTVEVSSPALIEKVRTAVSDSQGRYQVVDLRPGSYAVTFTLPGFSSVKREGIELTSGFTATVNAELRVGAIAETVTVSGASPVVDTQNVLQQTVLTRQVLDAIPATKTVQSHAALTVGAAVPPNRQDVGGSTGEFTSAVAIHGIGGNES